MFDFDLQLRFWRGVTDAFLHSAEATMAAASAWQDEVVSAGKPKIPTAPFLPFMDMTTWPWGMLMPQAMPWMAPSAMTPFASPFQVENLFAANPFAASPLATLTPWLEIFWRQSTDAWSQTPTAWGNIPQPNMMAMLQPFWGWAATPWSFMQTPLTAMMMSQGLPYNVASPSAKAGTAAMDAAQAAHQQMESVFSAYRSDGGYAAAQMMTLPWSLAASFMDPSPESSRAA